MIKEQLKIDAIFDYALPHSMACNSKGVLALIVSVPDRLTNSYLHRLYIYDGKTMRQIFDMGRANWFLWTDDNHILLPEKTAPNATTLIRIDAESGSVVWRSSELPIGIKSIRQISPRHFAAVAGIDANFPDYYALSAEEKAAHDEQEKAKSGYQIVDELPFWVNGGTFTNKKRNALFLLDIELGSCVRVTAPLFQTASYCVIDGTVYYCGEEYADKARLTNSIYKVRPGDDAPVCLYDGREYNMGNGNSTDAGGIFAWGDRLMMIANRNLFYNRRMHKTFYTIDTQTGEIAPFCDYAMNTTSIIVTDLYFGGGNAFVGDGEQCYFRSTIRNESKLMALHTDGTVSVVAENGGSVSCVAAANGQLFCASLMGQELPECYRITDGSFERISDFNTHKLDGVYVAKPEPVQLLSHGWEIDGFVMKPRDYAPDKTYPAILTIHGGPNTAFGTVFYHETQYWVNRGFFVFYCNPEGSEGRGDAFMDISGRYGEEDYETLMAFTDKVLETYPQIDKARVCVTGGSYGGFMTNWIVGHTDRFVCAATQRSISNWVTMQTVGDIGYHFGKDAARGSLTENFENIWAHSPIKYVGNVKTPTLVLHSDADYRCPVDQGIQFYGALKDLGVETRLCLFHGESHELNRAGRPLNRVKRLEELTDWFEKHV